MNPQLMLEEGAAWNAPSTLSKDLSKGVNQTNNQDPLS